MSTKFYKNEKFQKVFFPTMYFVLIVLFVCSACFAFSKLYYEHIYVSGTSMNPTLVGEADNGGRSHYGKADKSRRVIDRLNRFDVVITYFPEGWSSDEDTYKIKRVWGFPGETLTINVESEKINFKVTKGNEEICFISAMISEQEITVGSSVKVMKIGTFNTNRKTFRVNANSARTLTSYTLKNDEYFLMGDNWESSYDSYSNRTSTKYITNPLIQGKVVQIEGTANIVDGKLANKQLIQGMFEF